MRSIIERNKLAEQHLKLAKTLADRRYATVNRTVTHDELLSAAYLGLLDAASRFDPLKVNDKAESPFECYAVRRIKGSMNDYLRACNWGTRNNPRSFSSIEALKNYDCNCKMDGLTLRDTIPSREHAAVDALNRDELFEKVTRSLSRREKYIFKMRFQYGLTMLEIADSVDLSESRVSQILSSSVVYLKEVWNDSMSDLFDEIKVEN